MEFTLQYRQVVCDRCGAPRIAGVTCPDCGRTPADHEADSDRQVRQARAARARERLTQCISIEKQPSIDITPQDVFEKLGGWATEFFTSLARASSAGPEYRDELQQSIDELCDTYDKLRHSRRLRPWIGMWRDLDKVCQHTISMVRAFLDAVSSDRPLDAQLAASRANNEMQGVVDAADAASNRINKYEELSDYDATEGQLLSMAAAEVFANSNATDIISLDREGLSLYRRLTGHEEMPIGAGIGLQIVDLQADYILDRKRLWDIAHEIFRYIEQRSDKLTAFVSTPDWLDDYHKAMESIHDAAIDYRTLSQHARRDRDVLRALLSLAQDLHESSRALVATIAALRGSTRFSKLSQRDAADLVRILTQRRLGPC